MKRVQEYPGDRLHREFEYYNWLNKMHQNNSFRLRKKGGWEILTCLNLWGVFPFHQWKSEFVSKMIFTTEYVSLEIFIFCIYGFYCVHANLIKTYWWIVIDFISHFNLYRNPEQKLLDTKKIKNLIYQIKEYCILIPLNVQMWQQKYLFNR